MSRFAIDWNRKDARLRKMYAEGKGPKLIAEALGVSHGAVARRIRQLDLSRSSQDD
jgi:transcriptional regulator of aromatic amino acid metabolism